MSARFARARARRAVLLRARDALLCHRTRGLTDFAREERLSAAHAGLRLVQFAHFHRAAEAYLGRRVRSRALVQRVLRHEVVDDGLVAYLASLATQQGGASWAARAYETLLLAHERRGRGQFFTPELIARVMAEWAVRSKTDRVLDAGSGPGQLLAAAHARLRSLGAKSAAGQLVGVEISPLAPTFAALALAPVAATPRVTQADFLTGFRARHASFDAVVANPPYSRHHALSRTYKEWIGELADGVTGARIHRSAGLYVHFLVRSLAFLKNGGRLAFLTPREFFDARYGRALRSHLLETSRLRALIVFDPRGPSAFNGVRTTSVVTLLERGSPDGAPVRVVHLRRMPAAHVLSVAVEPEARPGKRDWGWVEDVPLRKLAEATRWSQVMGRGPRPRRGRDGVALGELATVKRGIATGANRFFVLSQQEANALGLRNGSLRPVIARARLAISERITTRDFERWRLRGERVWLLDIRHNKLTKAERAYLKTGEELGYHCRRLARERAPWYRMERREPPAVLVTYMSKDRLRFVRNDAALVPLNVFHGLYPTGLTPKEVEQLLLHLNGGVFRRQLQHAVRTYGGGLLKVEPRELLAFTVPDVRSPK